VDGAADGGEPVVVAVFGNAGELVGEAAVAVDAEAGRPDARLQTPGIACDGVLDDARVLGPHGGRVAAGRVVGCQVCQVRQGGVHQRSSSGT
jgi:hypothetical protein